MMIIEQSKSNWKSGISISISIGLFLFISLTIIGVDELNMIQNIASGLISGLIFSTAIMGIVTFWFSFSRKQPWMPAIASLIPIFIGIFCAYFCYEYLDIKNPNYESMTSQGLANFLQMISAIIASIVAIIFSLVILQRNSSENTEEE